MTTIDLEGRDPRPQPAVRRLLAFLGRRHRSRHGRSNLSALNASGRRDIGLGALDAQEIRRLYSTLI